MWNRVLTIRGLYHRDALICLNNLASIYGELATINCDPGSKEMLFQRGEQLHIDALSLRKETLGNDHPDTLGSRRGLACLYAGRGDSRQLAHAILLQNEVLHASQRIFRNDHPEVLTNMQSLTHMYGLCEYCNCFELGAEL